MCNVNQLVAENLPEVHQNFYVPHKRKMTNLAGTRNQSGRRIQHPHSEKTQRTHRKRTRYTETLVWCLLMPENVSFCNSTGRTGLELRKLNRSMQILHGLRCKSKTCRDCVSMFLWRIPVFVLILTNFKVFGDVLSARSLFVNT